MEHPPLEIIKLPLSAYAEVWQAMRKRIEAVQNGDNDQWWLVEHPPVFTLGLNADLRHLLQPGSIPLVHSDRGGQITYHGPGQLIIYFLMDLRRLKMGIKQLVCDLEQGVIQLLNTYDIDAFRRQGAPGVYTEQGKIAALGLRVKKGWSYHGLSLNLDLDLAPFNRINPCGMEGLPVTRLQDLLDAPIDIVQISSQLTGQYLSLWGHALLGMQD